MKRNYSGSFGIKALVDGLPVEFGADNESSSSLKEYYAFEKEILKTEAVSDYILTSVVTNTFSINQLEAYKECLRTKCTSKDGVIVTTGGDPEDIFFVRIAYTNTQVFDVPPLEIKESVCNGCIPVYNLNFQKGETIENGKALIQHYKRNDPNKKASVSVDFENQTSIKPVVFEKVDKFSSLPIGSIVSSVINYADFSRQITDKAFDKTISTWAPCDGRNVKGSTFSTLFAKDYVPDLRGQFLRGNYTMGGPSEPSQNTPNGNNPRSGESDMNGYTYQSEGIKNHRHQIRYYRGRANRSDGGSANHEVTDGETRPTETTHSCLECINETRPKNIYVYYYVRIN